MIKIEFEKKKICGWEMLDPWQDYFQICVCSIGVLSFMYQNNLPILGFNRKGNYLAAACTFKSSKTIIKIFDVEEGVLFAELKGHSNIIHDIKFSFSSLFLITVSSDQTAKVWKVPKHSGETIH